MDMGHEFVFHRAHGMGLRIIMSSFMDVTFSK